MRRNSLTDIQTENDCTAAGDGLDRRLTNSDYGHWLTEASSQIAKATRSQERVSSRHGPWRLLTQQYQRLHL